MYILTILFCFEHLVENNELFDLRALRLDWFRLQAYTSVSGSGSGGYGSKSQQQPLLSLFDNRQLAAQLDTVSFHTRMVDYLDEMMVDTSDLSIFW